MRRWFAVMVDGWHGSPTQKIAALREAGVTAAEKLRHIPDLERMALPPVT